jgi:RNA polymerase sigma-70 factor (ECF subfamily)
MVNVELIERCIREDRKAQYELYRSLYPLMMSICTRYERNRDDAVSTMNNGFLKVLQNIGKRNGSVPFELWVRRVMINTVIDGYRHKKVRKELEILQDVPEESGSNSDANEYLKIMEAEAFERLLQGLSPVTRHVFNLFAMDGHSHAEISEMLGISTGTSKWHVSHARQELQRALGAMASKKATIR